MSPRIFCHCLEIDLFECVSMFIDTMTLTPSHLIYLNCWQKGGCEGSPSYLIESATGGVLIKANM